MGNMVSGRKVLYEDLATADVDKEDPSWSLMYDLVEIVAPVLPSSIVLQWNSEILLEKVTSIAEDTSLFLDDAEMTPAENFDLDGKSSKVDEGTLHAIYENIDPDAVNTRILMKLLEEDQALSLLRYRIVPKDICEDSFWIRYKRILLLTVIGHILEQSNNKGK